MLSKDSDADGENKIVFDISNGQLDFLLQFLVLSSRADATTL